jgi:hypothetical protein
MKFMRGVLIAIPLGLLIWASLAFVVWGLLTCVAP